MAHYEIKYEKAEDEKNNLSSKVWYTRIYSKKTPTCPILFYGQWAWNPIWKNKDEIIDELHRVLYDTYQYSETIKNGDTFHLPCCFYQGYLKKIKLPETNFECLGVHVIKI